MVKLKSNKRINEILADLPGVWKAVDMQARSIGSRAKAILGSHFYEGQSRIEVEEGGFKSDSFVWLVDPAAMSIEFGHMHNFTGKRVLGLYVIHRASGMFRE